MKFTIIIPTYNYGHFITDCLNSVLEQSYINWECIIIDNASTDNTKEICTSYLKDARFTYHLLNENKGPSIARNYALNKANGSYILFLDSDDLIESQKLNQASIIINTYNVDFVFTNYSFFNSDTKIKINSNSFTNLFEKGIINSSVIRDKLIQENLFAISCIISKKESLRSVSFFDETLSYNEDWDLWLRVSFNNYSFYYDDTKFTTTLIRNHTHSFSKDTFAMYLAGLSVCKKNYNQLNKQEKIIFSKKINSHLYSLKLMLIDFYFNDKLKFNTAIIKLNANKYLKKELLSYQKQKWLLPKSCKSIFLFNLKVNHYLKNKWL